MSTSSTSALSSLLSSLNNGNSGLDVTSAVASVIYAERAPERAWQAQQTTLNNQAAALQQLESEAASVTDALQSLGDVGGTFSSVASTSSNTAVVTASASAGTAIGTHTVQVSQLAATGSSYSDEQASSSAALASGSFDVTEGGTTKTFSTGSGAGASATLDQLAASINSAGIGVNASVVNDANGARLAIVAQTSGSAADFTISNASGLTFQHVAGKDASLTVDGVPVTSASNTVTGAVAGLTLNLQSESTNPVTISVAPETAPITSAVNNFVTAYNSLIKDLKTQFTYNSGSGGEGVLASDSTARNLQSDVLNAANLAIGSGSITSLAALGVSTQQDGTLSLDSAALNRALSGNYQGVVDFFQGTNANGTNSQGFSAAVASTLNGYTDTSQGAFTVDLKSLRSEYEDLTAQTTRFELYIATQQTLLTTEYNNANIALQQLPQTIKQTQALLGTYSSGNN